MPRRYDDGPPTLAQVVRFYRALKLEAEHFEQLPEAEDQQHVAFLRGMMRRIELLLPEIQEWVRRAEQAGVPV